jgi:hypothetical protein
MEMKKWEKRLRSNLESVTNANITINNEGAKLNAGKAFSVSFLHSGFNNNDIYNYKFKACPGTDGNDPNYIHLSHMRFFSTASRVEVKLIEVDEDLPNDGGTLAEPINRSRINGISSCVNSYHGITVDLTEKTTKILDSFYIGSGGLGSGAIGETEHLDFEFILKPGKTYLFQFTNLSGSNNHFLNLWFLWYEEQFGR